MKKIGILLLCISGLYLQAAGQSFSIRGKVLDAQDQSALPGAHISATRLSDSLNKAVVSNTQGFFTIDNLSPGQYEISISYLGMETHKQNVQVVGQNINLPAIALQTTTKQLEEVTVEGQAVAAVQKGDTTEFNADAYKTNPDATASDLLQKMPGIVEENGQTQAQGEQVQQVLVNGRPFFGNDPNAALKNLPAEVVDKIQVFDQRSDQAQFTGFEDGQTTKTINIITKPETRNGTFGSLYAGYGTDDRYKAGGNVNIFKEDMRLSILGQTNNINQQNFSADDLLGVVSSRQRRGRGFGGRGGGRGGGGGFRGGNGTDNFLVAQQDGISQTHAFGLNYTDKWGLNTEITASYFFNRSNNDVFQDINQVFLFASQEGQTYEQNEISSSINTNHRFNMRIDHTINENNTLLIRPRLSIQQNEGTSQVFGETFSGEQLLNRTDNQVLTDYTAINFSNTLLYRHRFAKQGRTISLFLNTTYNEQEGERFQFADNLFLDADEITLDTLDQLTDLDNSSWNIRTGATFTERVGRRSQMELTYRYTYQKEDSDQQAFAFSDDSQDFDQSIEPIGSLLDLSNVFESNYQAHSLGGGYRYFKRKIIFVSRLSFQSARLETQSILPESSVINRDFFNVLPLMFFRLNISQQKNIRAVYRASTNVPSVTQLQSVIDNSNPIQLSTGNPELDQNYQHNVFVRYSATNPDKSTVFFALVRGQYTDNYIANSTLIADQEALDLGNGDMLPQGSQITSPVNLDGYWNVGTYVTYGIPISVLKSNLNFDFDAAYNRIPGLINNERNNTNNYNVGIGLSLSSNISKKVDFTVSSRTRLNWVENQLQSNLNDQYVNQDSRVRFYWNIWKGIVLRTNIIHQAYFGLAEGFNQNYFLLNASLGKKIFKNQRGEITLSVFDALKENVSIQRNITETLIEDVRNNVLQRYVMLTFTYNLREFKPTQPTQNRRNPFAPRR